ncbi:MAG TPA: chromosome segregation protein SMC [Candidatus Faecousia intestinigallinarum]|nr:chromosome segregation protein SMC [Candidatus Faecousia intestinigallinarum]
MYLKSLEVQGFKSFPDRTLIRFGDDITAIVGPNGSGKSNISDAILWVMGEQSTKTLRGAKMEDVIFGGTQKRAAVGFAEATLTLDNQDRALLYDADEVMITRRYYRSGDSEYYINRQSARLRDIHELFMDTGLGREGYSNIGQGRIDEILSLKSADRREIFEEAAGISKYRHRKEETERKLAATEDNLTRIGDKVSELEMQVEPLWAQSEKAKKYLSLKDELQGVEVAVWLQMLAKLSESAKKAQEDYTSAAFVLQQAHEDLDKHYVRAEELGEELRRKDGQVETIREKVNMQEAAGQQLEGQLAVLQSQVDNNRENLARIAQECQAEDDRRGGIAAQMRQAEDRVAEITASLEEKRSGISALEQELAAMTANAQGLQRQYLELRAKETRLSSDIAALEAEQRSLEAVLTENAQRSAQLEEDMAAAEQRENGARNDLKQAGDALRAAGEEVTAAQNTISGYELRLSARTKRRDELDHTAREITSQLESVRAKAQVFQAMERDFEGLQKSVRQVMQQSRAGRLSGVHGPVSHLIRTEDAYTVAVEIALGGAMQQIVVGTELDGKAAIAFLKRTGAGRATFLPLSVIRGKALSEQGLERCRGFVEIASKLVTCREEYRPIVENLLGRIVIVEDMDAAIAMAGKFGHRFKIVTLDGQVVNPGGSMSGGAVNKEAGILSRANELEKLTARQKDLTAQAEQIRLDLREAQRSVDEVAFQRTTAAEQLREAQDRVLLLQGQVKQHEILLQTILDAQTAAAAEKASLEKRRTADRERLAAQTAKKQIFDGELQQTRQALRQLDGSQSETAERSGYITDSLTALKTQEAALLAEAETARTHIADLQRLRSSMEGDRDRKRQLSQAIQEETARLLAQMEELRGQREENTGMLQELRREMESLLAQRLQTEADKTLCERQTQEKNKDILNMERACALLEQKRQAAQMEEKQIIDRLWDNYGLTPGTAEEKKGNIESVAMGNRRIGELKRSITALGTPNLGAIEEYARVNERYQYLSSQRDDVLTAKRELESVIRSITQEMTGIFVTEFRKIDEYFGKTFAEMFGGGKGQLILEDPGEPLTCGIEIRVQPPGKQVKTITLLSGGEKAFVAIALYFAILKVRPTPFCMLDEIDAALDDRNVERFANYLRNLSEKTQFIVITHRRGTMEASDVLYGVTMQEQGISKLLRLDLNQMEQYLGIME